MRKKPSPEEVKAMEKEIRGFIAGNALTSANLSQAYLERYNVELTRIQISRNLKQGNIPFYEVRRIADLYGYEMKFMKKDRS